MCRSLAFHRSLPCLRACRSALLCVSWFTLLVAHLALLGDARGQLAGVSSRDPIPRDIREIYERGANYLASTQLEDGSWSSSGQDSGPGVTGLALMVWLASGEDPNFGRYHLHIKRAVRSILNAQDTNTGYLGPSMYHHGFAMLALAEAYGAVDESQLWAGQPQEKRRSIGQALELAVRCAITSQRKNAYGGWRYSPDASDADTSVSGAVLVGLLAARNAGIEVPDAVIDRAINYYKSMTSDSGHVAYSGGLGGFDESLARTAIAALVFAVARRKDLPQYKATINYLTERLQNPPQSHYLSYTRYYQAQALFQGDVAAWEKWNTLLVRELKASQLQDGSFPAQYGVAADTSLNLLALAVNFRYLPIYER